MANIGTSAVRIIDSDGDVVTVRSNKLDVNATLADGTEILEAGYSTVNHIAVNVTDSAVQFGSNTCSHIDIMAKIDQIKTSADISLLLADTLNDHIDEIFKTFGSDPSFSRKNFPTAEQFYGTQPWNTLMLKAKELNDRYTVEGNPLYHKGIAGFLGSLESSL